MHSKTVNTQKILILLYYCSNKINFYFTYNENHIRQVPKYQNKRRIDEKHCF